MGGKERNAALREIKMDNENNPGIRTPSAGTWNG
jgi:hypothetical protein